MDQFTDLAALGTTAGATAAITIIVQFAKILTGDRGTTKTWKALAAVLGVAIIVTVWLLSEPFSLIGAFLAVINGMIVGVAASALYDGTHRLGVRSGIIDTD